MGYKHGDSLCISHTGRLSDGLRVLPASTLGGLARNLTASEMLSEVYTEQRDSGKKVGSIVSWESASR